MKQLRLRQLARPLNEARKDPECGAAALFVERLLGRPMRGNPDVLIVTDENLEQYLRHVDGDFPERKAAFSPVSFMLSGQQRRRIAEEGLELFGPEDALMPARARERYVDLALNASARKMFMEIGGIATPQTGFIMKWTHPAAGLHAGQYDLVVSRGLNTETIVHELIHAEDSIIFGMPKTHLDYAITEGRATFGEQAFRESHCTENRPYPHLHLQSLLWLAKAMAKVGPGLFLKNVREKGFGNAFMALSEFIGAANKNVVRETSIHYQLIYLPYATALAEIAHAIGSPYEAFRISTQKPPTRWAHVFDAKGYYKAELEGNQRVERPDAGPVKRKNG